ncbi:hypothetical protein A2574_04060 [Candidatus Shapirobacteria bacterium RIFOXYD1_FULL_38_32]|uniref:Type IV secretory pathway VirB4 component-like protein n=3 Tax=Candidatus Shapironibacteriota TaxID=1752721 RepID=A0A0G0K4M1_9BACT|nr:MAG: Type IV secretory pathway VirB4 component-like protein [Candidatus Shapirobacteria bacterium GW2011_GWE2_38_30]OGL56715.1 MAG: hypothetical protein A2367_03525 [Candidatus Shapirobacteria bacterium RIFOXYB1_FULL_38_38]OGL56735.1 MAG: hypothetical protein A2410_02160 [Candidatus Shapirobacteria bacterium RIFOXYC1_FULL_38_24]OGL58291.1 MAG: hypothetical protein A2574_04060 [Candidatus Shapirobacteria bacterium RIFOXYD1_FULL_38_32]HAP38033.1 hypothetical protein [Candidatus Shapirobacteria
MNILDKLKLGKKSETAEQKSGLVEQKPEVKNNGGIQETKPFVEGLVSTKDIIAPSAIEIETDYMRIDNKFHRTLFVVGYPRFVGINWLSPLINFDASLNISMYIYPTDGKEILDDLRRKIAEMEAEISTDVQRGKIVNPATQAKLEDALSLQEDLVKGVERFYQFGLYVRAIADTKEDLNRITKNIESALGALMIITKKSALDEVERGFVSTLPICQDRLKFTRNMDTTSLATTFPFVSSDLSDDKGVMYGINEHNGSLVIFDRFSMPNYNSVVFATAGAGKSYMIKLEAMRSLMLGSEIIVIDPENEYKDLCEAVGGQYVAFGYGEDSKINPFDLSLVEEEGENALNAKILSLHKLFKTMIGEMDPMDESILDRAIMDAYKMKGITPDPESQSKEPPLIEDLYKSLIGMEDPKAQMLAARFEKFIKGSFAGIFNQKTTINLENSFVVFGVRNLEEALRPLAMHVILDYIWTVVKKTLKKRILVVDEAWYMMQYPDSASFLRGIVKRGRKYYLGVTTITQDVDDFLETPFGKEIVTNSSIQILLKQHSAAIDKVGEIFYLSEGEKQLLLAADKGEGIFFAGQNHVAIKVIASEEEDRLISSNPEEILKWKNLAAEAAKKEVVPSQGVEQNTFDQEAAINKLNENQTSEVDSEKVVEAKVVENKKPVDVPAKEEVVEKAEVKVEEEDEVVEVEDVLSRRIREMEEAEKLKLDEHQKNQESEQKEKQAAEEAKNKLSGEFTNFGAQNSGLPKYQDLFKSPAGGGGGKLPPLPPLPKFEPIIPQPPQLAKKPEPVLGENPNIEVKKTTEPVKNESKNPVANKDMKPDTYDKLFGNGIV